MVWLVLARFAVFVAGANVLRSVHMSCRRGFFSGGLF